MIKKKLQTAFSTRQYMFSKDFEIYYYSDIPLKAVSPHGHNYYEFYFFLEGNVDIVVGDQAHHIKPGDFILIPPEVEHYPVFLDHTTPYRRFILWISSDYVNHLLQASLEYGYLFQYVSTTHTYLFENDVISFNRIQSEILRIIEEVKNNYYGKDSFISLQINYLVLYLNRLIYDRTHTATPSAIKEIYSAIIDFVNQHLNEDLSLERLEREFFVSKYYISHTFRDNSGLSLHQYITKKRLQACKDAIFSGESISIVYQMYGFGDYSAFFRAFRKEYGMSPREYQEISANFPGTIK